MIDLKLISIKSKQRYFSNLFTKLTWMKMKIEKQA